MSELLVCVHDRGLSGVLSVDSHAPKQGDVIDVHPDGWVWGACELGKLVPGNPNGNHPFFRILKLPNVTVLQASNLLTAEVDVDPQHPSPYLQYRARFLDKSKIPAVAMKALLDHWNDDSRAQGFLSLAHSTAQLNSIISVRTPIPF